DDIVAFACVILARLPAETDQGGDADFAAVLSAGDAVDEAVVALGQIALRLIGITPVKSGCDDETKHSVAKELEPLIALRADTRVGEGQLEQGNVLRIMTELVSDERPDVPGHLAVPV